MTHKKIKTLQEFLAYSPAVARVCVKWGDMDSFQHVNNTMYFRYQEVSRTLLFDKILKRVKDSQFNHQEWRLGTGIGPIISHSYCSFKFPVSYPDNLLVGSVIHSSDISLDRVKVSHTIWSLKHQRMAAEGHATLVCYDFTKKQVVHIPEAMSRAIEEVHQENSLDQLESFANIVDFQSEF